MDGAPGYTHLLTHHLPMAIRLCLTIKVFLKVKIAFVLAGFHSTSSSNMLIFQFHFEYTGAWTVVLNFFHLYNLPGRLLDPKLFRNSFEIISSLVYINFSSESLKKSLLTEAWHTLGYNPANIWMLWERSQYVIGGPGPEKAQFVYHAGLLLTGERHQCGWG